MLAFAQNEFEKIIKRDGIVADFDATKITAAIAKAGQATGQFGAETAGALSDQVLAAARKTLSLDCPNVEAIQDLVEEVLMASPYRQTAKAYILYREQHQNIRALASRFNVGLVDQYLDRTDWQVQENSNMDFSLQGLNNYISAEVSKVYWLNKIYSTEIREAHSQGDLHIHDLGTLSAYCVGWDLQDLLIEGFRGVSGKVESAPAKHLRTALGQVVNFFYTLQGEAAGAQAFSHFDTLLAPFIRYDNLEYKGVKQALQEFLFNINVPTRVGFQTPFTNVTLDLEIPSFFRDQSVMIGGKPRAETYKEFKPEMDLFNKAFLEVMYEGDAKGRVFTFPIPTYNITKDFDWENPQLEILWQVTAKYGLPYFANFVHSDMSPDDARSMCCRLRIDNRALLRKGGGLFGASPLTGSIGVVTINMPRLGLLAQDEPDFLERLSAQMILAKESLEIKRKVIEQFTETDLYPYMKFYLRHVKTRFGAYWKNHFSTIGIIGMQETCQNLLGEDIASENGRQFTLRVMDFMRGRLLEFQKQTGFHYNLEATPAEGVSYRFAQADAAKFNGKGRGTEAPMFYTNSTHLPVNYTDDLFEALDLQDEIQAKYTGGTVIHVYVGEEIKEIRGLKNLVKKICSQYRLPYFSITPTFSVCPDCGYQAGKQEHCPKCGKTCEVYSRVVGYLRPVQQWNAGKKAEFQERKTYKI